MAARWQWLLCFALSLWPTAAGKRAPPGDIIHRGTGTGLEGAERPTDVHGRDIEMYERQSTIHQAAHMGDHERVRALMEAGISANTYDAAGLSPLHLSASAGHYMVSWLLLATPWDTSDDYPIRRESVELIPPVADTAAGFDPSDDREVLGWVYVDEEGREHGRSHELRGQTIEFDEDGRRISTVRSVIRKASSVDTGVDGDGDDGEGGGSWRGGARAELNSRALNVSNAFGDVQRHRFVTIQGETPMHYAARFGHTEIVDLFLSNVSGQVADVNAATVADINTGFGMLETPLHYAAKHGAVTICDKLIDAGANVGATTTEGWTPLLFAAQAGHVDAVVRLIERGSADDAAHVTHSGRGMQQIAHETVAQELRRLERQRQHRRRTQQQEEL